MPTPTADGQILAYPPTACLRPLPPGATGNVPPLPARLMEPERLFYVNGIQTDGPAHARTAEVLANIAERPVHGVYNATGGVATAGGFAADGLQCLADWSSSLRAKVTEYVGVAVSAPFNLGQHIGRGVARLFDPDAPPVRAVNLLVDVHRLVPEAVRVRLTEARLGLYNKATQSLYRELRARRGRPIMIVAHSQGNLITCDALWAMVYTYGERSLEFLQVYSLASPAPGWPLGIRYRRKVFGHTNDLVPGFFDPHNWSIFRGTPFGRTAGDWRQYGDSRLPGIAGHDVGRNIFLLNFANRLRKDLGLPPLAVPAGVN